MPTEEAKLLATARDRYKRGLEAENDNRRQALDALKFRNLEQWDPTVKRARENDPEGARPCLVVDKTNQYLRQILNDERENRPSIKVRPVDDEGDPEVAKVLQGLIRHIEDISRAEVAYDTGYEAAADGGFGYFRILTEYCDERSFDQDIKIQRIRNRFQVVLDPDRQEPDGSDAKWGFIAEKLHRDEYKALYPKADELSFEPVEQELYGPWIEKEHIVIAEYFYFEQEKKKLVMWADGSVSIEGEMPAVAGLAPMIGKDGKPVERQTVLKRLKWAKINAKEVLDSRDLPGIYIPIVEIIGEELDIEGKSVKSGLLKRSMEPQRVHNYATSSFVENVALAPRAPWTAAEGQIEGHENDWKSANRRNLSVLVYKPVVLEGNVPVPPPMRQPPPGIPAGWQQVLVNTEHDIQASMGTYAETTLGLGNANSGKQEAMQQRRGDTATFHFRDNLSLSIRHAGRIILSWIPVYYDSQRTARIIGEDGQPQMVKLNPEQEQAYDEENDSYNLKVGKYDVTVTTGPSYLTKRQEAAAFLAEIATAAKDPETAKVITYLAIKNNDWAGADEATRMLKKLLPPQVAEDQEEGQEDVIPTPQGPLPVSKAPQVIADLMQQAQMLGQELDRVKAQQIENDRKKIEIQGAEAGAKIDKTHAETAKITTETAATAMMTDQNLAAIAQAVAQQTVQQLLDMHVVMPHPGGMPMGGMPMDQNMDMGGQPPMGT